MHQLNVGIIGFGRIGAEHADWLAQAKDIRAVAVADATAQRRALAQQRGLHVYDNLDAMLANPTINAVLVSTPSAMHFEHASAALVAGKDVLIEKPMALDLEQSLRLIELAERHHRVLSVFHNRRWDIDYLTVLHHVRQGTFGKVINIEGRLGQWSSCVGPAAREYRPNWRNEASFGGGGLYDWGSHFLDQIWQLMVPAKPVRVFAQLRGNVWTADCDDFARVCIDFDNGAVAMVEINTTTTRPGPRWHIDGTAGSADSPHSPNFDTSAWAELTFTPAGQTTARTLVRAAPGLSEPQIWHHFAAACRGESAPAIPVETVLPTMRLLDAARTSTQTGQAIELE